MQSVDIENARRDLLQWSPPIIADTLSDAYLGCLGADHLSLRVFGSMHARLWRVMLQGERDKLNEVRRELTGHARLAGVAKARLDAIDQIVLNELLDVVTARFLRSPDLARAYSRLLLTASANLAEMRLVTA